MTKWDTKPLFQKVGNKNPFQCGEQYPFFKKPSILLIPQQHTPPKDFSQSPFQPQTPQTHPAEKEMQVLMLKRNDRLKLKQNDKLRLKMKGHVKHQRAITK